MVSYRSRILYAVGHDGSDAAGVHACLRAHEVEAVGYVQITTKEIFLLVIIVFHNLRWVLAVIW